MRPRIADYDIIEPLAPGRSASDAGAFRAKPPPRLGWSDDVVVETIELAPEAWPSTTEYLARAASIGSEHLAVLLEVAPTPEGPSAGYLSREHCPGGSLERPSSPLERSTAMRLLAGAARGVHDLHEIGLTHGAIRPGRILAAQRGGVLAVGNGSAGVAPGLVVAGDQPWRLGWLDPEVLRGGPVSRTSDVWSLGATLHWALTGSSVYEPKANEAPGTRVFHALYNPAVVDSSVGEGTARLIAACVSQDISRRPASAAQFADELEALGGQP